MRVGSVRMRWAVCLVSLISVILVVIGYWSGGKFFVFRLYSSNIGSTTYMSFILAGQVFLPAAHFRSQLLPLNGTFSSAVQILRAAWTNWRVIWGYSSVVCEGCLLGVCVAANLSSWLEAGKHSSGWKSSTPTQNLWFWLLKGKIPEVIWNLSFSWGTLQFTSKRLHYVTNLWFYLAIWLIFDLCFWVSVLPAALSTEVNCGDSCVHCSWGPVEEGVWWQGECPKVVITCWWYSPLSCWSCNLPIRLYDKQQWDVTCRCHDAELWCAR